MMIQRFRVWDIMLTKGNLKRYHEKQKNKSKNKKRIPQQSPGSRAVRTLVVLRGYGVPRGAKGEIEIPLLP